MYYLSPFSPKKGVFGSIFVFSKKTILVTMIVLSYMVIVSLCKYVLLLILPKREYSGVLH